MFYKQSFNGALLKFMILFRLCVDIAIKDSINLQQNNNIYLIRSHHI